MARKRAAEEMAAAASELERAIEAEAAATSDGGADVAAAAGVSEAKNDADGDDLDGTRVPARVAATGVDADPSRRLNRRRHLDFEIFVQVVDRFFFTLVPRRSSSLFLNIFLKLDPKLPRAKGKRQKGIRATEQPTTSAQAPERQRARGDGAISLVPCFVFFES